MEIKVKVSTVIAKAYQWTQITALILTTKEENQFKICRPCSLVRGSSPTIEPHLMKLLTNYIDI
jgi:hypothetical protein